MVALNIPWGAFRGGPYATQSDLEALEQAMAGSGVVRFVSFVGAPPSASELLNTWVADATTVFAANLPLAVGAVQTPPANPYTLSLTSGGSTVGNITISTAGVVSFSMANQLTLTRGQTISVVGSSTVDNNIYGIALNIPGSLSS